MHRLSRLYGHGDRQKESVYRLELLAQILQDSLCWLDPQQHCLEGLCPL